MTGTLILLGIGFMALRAYNVAQAAQLLKAVPAKIAFVGISRDYKNIEALIIINLTNSTDTSIPIEFIKGKIDYKGKLISTFNSNKINIAAKTTTAAQVQASINYTNLLGVITDYAETKQLPQVTVSGTVKALGVSIPFTQIISANMI